MSSSVFFILCFIIKGSQFPADSSHLRWLPLGFEMNKNVAFLFDLVSIFTHNEKWKWRGTQLELNQSVTRLVDFVKGFD